MPTRVLGSTRPYAGLLGLVALASSALPALPAHAVAASSASCGIHTTAADVRAESATVVGQLDTTERDLRGATVTSPAAWRLREQADTLRATYALLGQLEDAIAIRDGATPGSAAQWRAQESHDTLCEQLDEG